MDKKIKSLYSELIDIHEDLASSAPVNKREKPTAKKARMDALEADPEAWFKYYFHRYAKSEPADFHKAATKRVITNPEWEEVRSWARELAKSTRTMMEVFYLVFVGNPLPDGTRRRKKNALIIGNSADNAERLLLPYFVNMTSNRRLINDYGVQRTIGLWTSMEFTCKVGCSFRAVGAGQSPRGTRNEDVRPDIIVFDDLDTDADCRNPEIIQEHWNWVEEAVKPTRSISNPCLVLWCGNIIAEDCCVKRAQEYADHVDIINITDADGISSWPQKNSQADVERILSKLSYTAQQKEYFNNPMAAGKTFPAITWGKCPPIHELPFVVVYADPAPGNKDRPGAKTTQGNSRKAVFVVGRRGNRYYIYYGFLDVVGTDSFIRFLYDCRDYVKEANKGGVNLAAQYTYIENNSLQDPFYDQVYRRAIIEMGDKRNGVLSIMPDTRKKPDKWFRIEAALEPINTRGDLIFNEDEKGNEHMKRLADQFISAKPSSKQLDGPDCIEGAVFIIDQKLVETSSNAIRGTRRQRSSSKGY